MEYTKRLKDGISSKPVRNQRPNNLRANPNPPNFASKTFITFSQDSFPPVHAPAFICCAIAPRVLKTLSFRFVFPKTTPKSTRKAVGQWYIGVSWTGEATCIPKARGDEKFRPQIGHIVGLDSWSSCSLDPPPDVGVVLPEEVPRSLVLVDSIEVEVGIVSSTESISSSSTSRTEVGKDGGGAPSIVMAFAVSYVLDSPWMASRFNFETQAPLSRCCIIPGKSLNFLLHFALPRHFTGLWSLESKCAFNPFLLGNVNPHGSQLNICCCFSLASHSRRCVSSVFSDEKLRWQSQQRNSFGFWASWKEWL